MIKIDTIEHREQIVEGNNKIIADEKSVLEKSSIVFRGKNNILYMTGVRIHNSRIVFTANGAICFLNSSPRKHMLKITLTQNNVFYMGKNNSMNGVLEAVISEEKHIFIGNDNMFAHGVYIRNADPHLIYSAVNKKRVNPSRSVFVGDHVWIGQNVFLLKGTKIHSGSIIGANSVVAGKTISSNCAWGGDPARMIKSGLFWSRECVHNWTRKDTEKFATMDTDEYIFSYDEKNYIPFDVIERRLSENNLPEEKLNFLKGFSEKTIKNRFAI